MNSSKDSSVSYINDVDEKNNKIKDNSFISVINKKFDYNEIMEYINDNRFNIILLVINIILFTLLLYHIITYFHNLNLLYMSYTKLNLYKNKYSFKDFFIDIFKGYYIPINNYTSFSLTILLILYILSIIAIIVIIFLNNFIYNNYSKLLAIYVIIALINIIYISIYINNTYNNNKTVYENNLELNDSIYSSICPKFLYFISNKENSGKHIKELLKLYTEKDTECLNKKTDSPEDIIKNRLKLLITYKFDKYYINFKNTLVSSEANILSNNKLNIFQNLDSNKSNVIPPLIINDSDLNDILIPFDDISNYYNITDDKIKIEIEKEYNLLQSKSNNNIKEIKYYSDSLYVKIFILLTILSLLIYVYITILYFLNKTSDEDNFNEYLKENIGNNKKYIFMIIIIIIFTLLVS
jgi:hypothetical protein